ncbi:hypothetical protein HYPSUDRAFT_220163 [Hypholoma sublateritium FD-334 SS-4]|uniref:Uncharacterized protein n=1 Tax=Hypholoma sublateritium (strain FD-334 SS-4) TaxID=945553 RepID=A0A0D2N814_HYPSF|nr:hypothetical protein HYPSUDRAFT_220163 [Hypholoma sublateritium FD-334 SS-4]
MQQFLLIDDTDPAIQYDGLDLTIPGPSFSQYFYNNTFHQLIAPSAPSGLSFDFYGTDIIVGGAIFLQDPQLTDQQPFSAQCTIDGTPVPFAS